MNNPELVIAIITSVLTIIGLVLGILAIKSEKARKYYKAYVKVEKKIKELIVFAEQNYKKGTQKKKYVLTYIKAYLEEHNIKLDLKIIDEMIESLIGITKKINI